MLRASTLAASKVAALLDSVPSPGIGTAAGVSERLHSIIERVYAERRDSEKRDATAKRGRLRSVLKVGGGIAAAAALTWVVDAALDVSLRERLAALISQDLGEGTTQQLAQSGRDEPRQLCQFIGTWASSGKRVREEIEFASRSGDDSKRMNAWSTWYAWSRRVELSASEYDPPFGREFFNVYSVASNGTRDRITTAGIDEQHHRLNWLRGEYCHE
jgi:hypothetical protein